MNLPSTVHIMATGLTPGDALSNFAISSMRILRQWGIKVNLYAENIAPEYGAIAQHPRYYPNTGNDFLWFHYSIYTENLPIALNSKDYKIMDFHGISPPHLFHGQNKHLAILCQKGLDFLPSLNDKFDGYVVHSEYSREWLESLGYPPELITKVFYCIDTSIFTETDAELAVSLSKLDYFLLVGRIVPQKDVLALIEIFSHINMKRPETVLILVGSRRQTEKYQLQIDRLIQQKGLKNRVMFTGQVNNPSVLAALFTHARLLVVTSEWESFCVPVAESLHFGVPTAVHNIPPLPEVAGPAGLVFDKADPQKAAQDVLALLDDTEQYQQMSQMAHNWAAQYTDEALAENMKAMFNRLS